MTKTPIGIIAFSRPALLTQVIESLRNQEDGAVDGREIHLFQDGAVNQYSGLRRARDEDVEACVEVFRRNFPNGVVHPYDHNIGICENFDRAENYFFDERHFDCALFFEDDMVLSPAYLTMMDQLEEKARDLGHVAYFSAYGDYYDPPAPDDELYNAVIEMDHHWAFGLFAHARAQIRRYIEPYLEIVYGTDYSRRNHRAILEMYRQGRSCPDATSQDAAKAHACAQLGYWRCRTSAPYARYIGIEGQHMTKERYEQLGFEHVSVNQSPILLEWPTGRRIQDYIIERRNSYFELFRNDITAMLEKSICLLSPIRPCTETDVIDAYRLFLGREPENVAIIDGHKSRTPVHSLVTGILRSHEFHCNQTPENELDNNTPLATEYDVERLYNLLLHREPEDKLAVKRRADKYTTLSIINRIMSDSEFLELSDALTQDIK